MTWLRVAGAEEFTPPRFNSGRSSCLRESFVKSTRYDCLDALRGLAASIVVLHHCFRAFDDTSQGLLWWLDKTPLRLLVSGRPAVILFFVLSGFVLALSLEGGMKYRDFVVRRFCRIYLPFAASILLAMGLFLFVEQATLPGYTAWYNRDEPITLSLILGHLLMLGDATDSSLNPVMWSLVYELRISLVFPLIMWATYRYRTWTVLASSLAASLCAYAALRYLGYGPREFHFSTSAAAAICLTVHFTFYFFIGAALAKHRDYLVGFARGLAPAQRFALLVASSAVLIGTSMFVTDISLGILSAVLIVLVLGSGTMTKALLESGPAAFLGRISYSLYLVHMPVFYFVAHAWPGGAMPMRLIWVAWPVLAVAAAAISYRWIEQPSMALGRNAVGWVKARPAGPVTLHG